MIYVATSLFIFEDTYHQSYSPGSQLTFWAEYGDAYRTAVAADMKKGFCDK